MALHAGTGLGPYEVREKIGADGMGEVYRATDTRLDRAVAIKVLPEKMADDPQSRQRFEREARAVSSLNHSHNGDLVPQFGRATQILNPGILRLAVKYQW